MVNVRVKKINAFSVAKKSEKEESIALIHVEQNMKNRIKKWKAGELDGLIGANNDIATYIKHYLFDKYNSSCQICGWNTVNKYTGKVPLQIHHIDGDCTNNSEENLQLLCPNCHSLTENFGSRNINCTRIDTRIR